MHFILAGLLALRGGHHLAPFLMTGVLGGYTTFSTAAVEVVRRLVERRWSAAVISALGMPAAATAAAALGLLIALADTVRVTLGTRCASRSSRTLSRRRAKGSSRSSV